MKNITRLVLCMALVLALVPVGLALADETPIPPCAGDSTAGTVVAVDEATGVVTLDTGDGDLCTVTISADGDYDHPIVSLLGQYFGQISAGTLAEALAATEVWVVCDEDEVCTLAEEGDEDAVQGQVVGVTENEDGTFTLEVAVEGEDDPLSVDTEDEDLAGDLGDALAALAVDWDLGEGEDGPVVQDAAAEIAELHEDGMGFGVIVKLYALAAASQEGCADEASEDDGATEGDEAEAGEDDEAEACGVTVDELVEAFEDGQGLGQLFKEYGKAALLGVGHVRKALQAEAEAEADTEVDAEAETLTATVGQCGAQKHGKGRGNPHCASDDAASTDTTASQTTTDETDANTGPGNGGGNGQGHGNGGNNAGGNGGGNGGNNGGGNGGGRP